MSEGKIRDCDNSGNFAINKMHVLPQSPILSSVIYLLPQKKAQPVAFIQSIVCSLIFSASWVASLKLLISLPASWPGSETMHLFELNADKDRNSFLLGTLFFSALCYIDGSSDMDRHPLWYSRRMLGRRFCCTCIFRATYHSGIQASVPALMIFGMY